MIEVKRSFDLLDWIENRYSSSFELAGKENGSWIKYNISEYITSVNQISAALLSLGFKKGDKIVTVSNNRPEWNFLDMGMAQIGVVHVPLYPNLNEEEYEYLLRHSDCKAVVIGNKSIYNKVIGSARKAENIEFFYTIDVIENEQNIKDLIKLGEKEFSAGELEIKRLKESITESDLLTIIYTSGTTGTSKGVMLSHRALITNAISTSKAHYMKGDKRVLSFLPLCHIYERMLNYNWQYSGLGIYYAKSLGTVLNDLKDSKANMFASVPRFLEKVYDGIIAKGKDLTGAKRKLFFWAVDLGLGYEPSKMKFPLYRFKIKLARKFIFSKWIEALGGELKVIISGGAAIQERLIRIFTAAGISVQEGYGLTETGPVIAVNFTEESERRIGTVGPILPGVTCKLAEDGEILCKGPNVMDGYYKDPEYTKTVLDEEGWFHTGDIGILVENKFLKITDRKKSIFKLSAGKYIAPQVIENKLKESDFIEQAMVMGEGEKFASAIITPNFNYIHFWAAKHHIKFVDNKDLVTHEQLVSRIHKEVVSINKELSPHEHIKKIKVVAEEWSPQTGELSATLKLKRDVVFAKYKQHIEQIYK